MLNLQLMDGYHIDTLQLDIQSANDVVYGRQPAQTQDDCFFHPLCEPTLQIGYEFLSFYKLRNLFNILGANYSPFRLMILSSTLVLGTEWVVPENFKDSS